MHDTVHAGCSGEGLGLGLPKSCRPDLQNVGKGLGCERVGEMGSWLVGIDRSGLVVKRLLGSIISLHLQGFP